MWNKFVAVFQLTCRFQLCNTVDRSTPHFPALPCFQNFVQTHLYWVKRFEHVQPTQLLLPSSSPSLSLCHIRVNNVSRQGRVSVFSHVSFSQSIGALPSASVLPMNIKLLSLRIEWVDLLAVRDSQESPSARQVQSLSSLALSLLYHWTLTSIH